MGTGTNDGIDKLSMNNAFDNLKPNYGYGVPFSRSMSGTCFEPHFSTTFR